jgi:uncharacterized membrane-anchored protein
MLNKVPQVTLAFWFIKIMATTVGETGADYLAFNLGLGMIATTAVMTILLLCSLWAQIDLKRYIPSFYWVAVVLISIVGTLITDNLVDTFGVSLVTTTVAFAGALVATFALWYRSEKTLSIHTIFTRRRELFYWAAILFTFALGTAAGDLMAEHLGWGYGFSAVVFGGAIAAVTACYYLFKMNAVLAFWLAYILTRPFGASMGDLLSQPTTNGGLGFGTISTSMVFLVIIIVLIGYMTVSDNQTAK